MKEKKHRINLSCLDDSGIHLTDLSGYQYRLIGLVSCDTIAGQGDIEHQWVYLCENAAGQGVLITEKYDLSWWAGPGPENVSRGSLYALEEEPLTRAEFARYRSLVRPLDVHRIALPITLSLPRPPG